MKRFHSIAVLALLAAGTAHGQGTYEPAIPRGLGDTAAPASRELQPEAPARAASTARPVVPQLVTNNAKHQKDSDARRCLDLSSNRQVHRCAQRYLPAEARAKIVRTKARKSVDAKAAAPDVRAKAAADVGKADLSKAANAAKPVDTTVKAAPPAIATPPTTASVIAKPTATPAPAATEKAAPKVGDKPPKWTDSAKGILKSQGDRLPD